MNYLMYIRTHRLLLGWNMLVYVMHKVKGVQCKFIEMPGGGTRCYVMARRDLSGSDPFYIDIPKWALARAKEVYHG